MLDALRSNDNEAIARYRDIRPIDVDPLIRGMVDAVGGGPDKAASMKDRAVDRLLLLFIGRAEASEAVKSVLKGNPDSSLESLVRKAYRLASGSAVPPMDNTPARSAKTTDARLASSTAADDEF